MRKEGGKVELGGWGEKEGVGDLKRAGGSEGRGRGRRMAGIETVETERLGRTAQSATNVNIQFAHALL